MSRQKLVDNLRFLVDNKNILKENNFAPEGVATSDGGTRSRTNGRPEPL